MFDAFQVILWIRRNVKRQDVIIGAFILAVFFISRLVKLSSFPIFNDEGIYIRWAKVAWHDATWRFISLTDGRQPLQTWLTIPFLKLFPDNALFAGRLFGVASGLFGLIGVFILSTYLFNKSVGFIASLLYTLTPYFLFFNRLAMVDSLVNASYVWILFISFVLVSTLRIDVALILGILSGLLLLAKSSVSLFLGLAIFAPINVFKRLGGHFYKHLFNYIVLYVGAVIIAFLIYNVQRMSPFLHYVDQKNSTFVLTMNEFIKNPFMVFWNNVVNIPYYVARNIGFGPFLLGIIGLAVLARKKTWLSIYFLLWIIIPYGVMCFFMRVLFARYTIFLMTPFLMLTAYLIYSVFTSRNLQNKIAAGTVLVLSFIFIGYYNFTILFDHAQIPFEPVDRGQYLEGWPAGWGMEDIVSYAREKAKEKPVILLAEGNFGMSGDVLDVFLKRSDTNISIRGYWPLGEKELLDNKKELPNNYVYVVFTHKDTLPSQWPLKLIKKYSKPGNKSVIYLSELTQ